MLYKQLIGVMVLLLLPILSTAAIYQWTDAAGVIHYADEPITAAQSLKLDNATIMHSATTTAIAQQQKNQTKNYYTVITISQPASQATIWDNQGNVAVSLMINPILQQQDKIRLLLDGKQVAETKQLSLTLSNIERGAHEIQAQIILANGEIALSSKPQIFYLQQARVKQP